MTEKEFKSYKRTKKLWGSVCVSLPWTYEQLSTWKYNLEKELDLLKDDLMRTGEEFVDYVKKES